MSIITGISEDELVHLNPGFSTWLMNPSQQNSLLLPTKAAKTFNSRYNKITKLIFENKAHKVIKGDSLYKISRIYNVKINALKKANNLTKDIIYIGQELNIPSEMIQLLENLLQSMGKSILLAKKKLSSIILLKI